MAGKTKSGTGSKKQTAAKPAAKAKSGPTAKGSGRGSKPPAKQNQLEMNRQHSQARAVLLFAASIFVACLILIEGSSLWKWIHDLLLGCFGGWVIIAPIFMAYIAVMTSMGKLSASLTGKIWLIVGVLISCGATGFLFGEAPGKTHDGVVKTLKFLYEENNGVGGGLAGGLFGMLFHQLLGNPGGKIAVVLLLFVLLMVFTGTTLIQLFRGVGKPVQVVSETIQTAKQRKEDARQASIDIPLQDALPAHPVHSEMANLFERPQQKPKAKRKSESLEKLKNVFGFADDDAPTQDPTRPAAFETPVAEGEVAPAGEGEWLEKKDPYAAENFPSLRKEAETVPVATARPMAGSGDAPRTTFGRPGAGGLPGTAGKSVASVTPASAADMDVQTAKDAEKAAAEFVKKHAENEKRELTTAADQLTHGEPAAYVRPPVSMLEAGKKLNPAVETEELQTNGRILVETLKSFGVQTKILDICRGPAVTRYELQPAAGVKISKITNLSDDIAMNLAAVGVRIEAPIPGKAAVGIEVPNKTKSIVRMRELVESNSFLSAKSKLTVALGRDIAGQVVAADLAKMPHLLIAGTTGSGKSVCINSLIVSTLYKATPDEVRFLMIDPKVVELGIYNGIPHLLVPVVTDPRKAAGALGWAVTEMLNRYKLFAEKNVRDLEGYNALAASMQYQDEDGQPMLKMPQIIIIIDELSDLMMAAPNEVEDAICRLAQMARAAGMHLVVATQRPSVDVVTGLIKANIPSRIAFAVSSVVDSRTILDGGGAEKLLGQGDMLFAPVGASKPRRVQGCYVSDSEIESIVTFVKSASEMAYDDKVIQEIEKNAVAEPNKDAGGDSDGGDPMIEEAVKCVVEAGQASTSLLQRRLRLGYARAGRLIDEMEQMGIVGPHEGSKPRQVLITYGQWLERNMQKPDESTDG